jgi:hypothetical protein
VPHSFGALAGWKDWASGELPLTRNRYEWAGRKSMRALTFVHPWGNFSCGTRVPSRAL